MVAGARARPFVNKNDVHRIHMDNLNIYRVSLNAPRCSAESPSDDQILARACRPETLVQIRVARLRLFGQIAKSAPPVLLAL
eukprot:7978996-Pyramimonas_sp.AAC.1